MLCRGHTCKKARSVGRACHYGRLLPDLWACKTGSYDDCAHLGAAYAEKVPWEPITPEETDGCAFCPADTEILRALKEKGAGR